MTIDNAIILFENLKKSTEKKAEIKLYESFIKLLDDLEHRDLNDDQYQLIEKELDSLSIESAPQNRKKYYRKQLSSFKEFLRKEFSFIPKNYYVGIGLVLGMTFGLTFGSFLFNNSASTMGMSLGMCAGIVIGSLMDTKAKKEGRVLNAPS